MISINDFAKMAITISKKSINITNIYDDEFFEKYGYKCPVGVMGRKSDNNLFYNKIGWSVSQPLIVGMTKTYNWIDSMVKKNKNTNTKKI